MEAIAANDFELEISCGFPIRRTLEAKGVAPASKPPTEPKGAAPKLPKGHICFPDGGATHLLTRRDPRVARFPSVLCLPSPNPQPDRPASSDNAFCEQKRGVVKYFFLSDGWNVGRVWELGGLWNELAWRRKPEIERLSLCIWEQGEKLWLYRVEEAVLMVEVKPDASSEADRAIGQVVLKRLISAEQAIELLCAADGLGDRNLAEPQHSQPPSLNS